MIKVRVKAPWMDGKGLHKIGETTEIETAAFDPLRMEEIRKKKAAIEEKVTIELAPAEPEKVAEPKKTTKSTKKSTKKG